jgi:hypothetical protein
MLYFYREAFTCKRTRFPFIQIIFFLKKKNNISRNTVRYHYKHSVLCGGSFNGRHVPEGQRVSVMIRASSVVTNSLNRTHESTGSTADEVLNVVLHPLSRADDSQCKCLGRL